MVLRIAGVDQIAQMLQPVADPQLVKPTQPYTGGLEVINNAGKVLERNIQGEQQGLQSRLGSLSAGYGARGESISVASQSATQVASATAQRASSGGGLLSDLANAAATVVTVIDKKKQAQLKAEQERQLVLATKAVGDLQLEWRERLYKDGVGPYRSALINTLSSFNIDNDNLMKLMREGYALADDYTKTSVAEQQAQIKATREKVTEVNKNQLLLQLNADLALIAGNPYESSDEVMKKVDQNIANFLNQPGLSELDKATSLSAALGETLKSLDTRNKSYVEIQQRLSALGKYANEEAEINKAVRQGGIGPEEANARKAHARIRLGVHPSYTDTDPLASQKYLRDYMALDSDINKMQEERFIDEAKRTQMSDQAVAYLAWQIIKSPDLAVALKNDKVFYATSGAQRAVEIAELYKGGRNKSAELATRKQALIAELAQAEKQDVIWFVNAARRGSADPNINKMLDAKMLGIPLIAPDKPITPEQRAQLEAAFSEYKRALGSQIQLIGEQMGDNEEILQRYGLYGSKAEVERRMQGYRSQYDAAKQQFQKMQSDVRSPVVPQGLRSPFEQGASKASFATMTYGGKNVRLPLEAGNYPISSDYGEDRGTRRHAGIDLAAPSGIKILSPVNGKVIRVAEDPQGYGFYLDVLGGDGKLHRFAHMVQNSALVRVGSKVQAGQWIGRVGNTGRSFGAHLHYEVRDPNQPYGINGTVNPLAYLGTAPIQKAHNYPQPRTNPKGFGPVTLPKDAFPLGNGYVFTGGKVVKLEGILPKQTPGYSSSAPLRQTYRSKGDMRPPNYGSVANHGYAILKERPSLAKAINNGAKQLGIPGAWLADLMAFETGGRFSSSVDNGKGYVGLIQCGSECRADLGLSYAQLAGMSPEEQVRRVVVPFIQKQIKYAGSSIKGIEWLLAAVWGGNGLIRDLDRRGAAAVNDPTNNDRDITFKNYLNRLGSHAGRRYDHLGNRSQRATNVKHTRFRPSCPTCNALRQAGGFQPHEAQTR